MPELTLRTFPDHSLIIIVIINTIIITCCGCCLVGQWSNWNCKNYACFLGKLTYI